MKKILSIVFLGLIITSNSMAYEEANYEVVKKNSIYEIRKYSDRLVIETSMSNEGSSFRKLFNYISGSNDKNEETSRQPFSPSTRASSLDTSASFGGGPLQPQSPPVAQAPSHA